MSRITFENYGRLASAGLEPTQVSGRYPAQRRNERNMVADVAKKLALTADDRLLEIGCSVGNLLIPLSFAVASATGIDHASVLDAQARRFNDAKIRRISGNFLDIDLVETFDKILIYGVLTCLSGRDEVFAFLEKASGLLADGGRMLIGDIPNASLKRRFLASAEGQRLDAEFRVARAAGADDERRVNAIWEQDPATAGFDDAFVLELLARFRAAGLEAYVLPQPPDLPFGLTREDILITRRSG